MVWTSLLTFFFCLLLANALPRNQLPQKLNAKNGVLHSDGKGISPSFRTKRSSDHIITECIFMTQSEGDFFYKSTDGDGTACGVYIFGEPDEKIELHFNYLDVPCENGNLVSFVDGWELNGEFFPSPQDHHLPIASRFHEFCGQKKVRQIFNSSQNVALIQYRMPTRGTSFSFSVRFVKNPTPCNVLFQDTDNIVTLRNYGRRSNCSISTLYPAAIKVIALDVGVVPTSGRSFEMETGILHKCHKRGLEDYAQIGGSQGLDSSNLELVDAVCGLNSQPAKHAELIACGTATTRLVSSGAFENSVTVHIRTLTEEDLESYMSVYCDM